MNGKGTQTYIYMYPFSPKLPSHLGCHTTLSRVSCCKQMFYVAVLIRELVSAGWKNRESVELGGDGLEITIGPIPIVQLESTFSSV